MRLLVLGDSLSFFGPSGPLPADHPRLWHNICAAELGGSAELAAGFGWTARDAWWALTGDPRIWSLLPRTDVLVFAVGSMDTLPSPLPTYLREGLRYVRPDWLRRWVRARYLDVQPRLAPYARTALPPALTARYLRDMLQSVRNLEYKMPAVGIVPSVHRAPTYRFVHDGHAAAVAAVRGWAARAGVPLLDLPAVIGEHVRSGAGNPDGMHWGWEGHELVGRAMAELISSSSVALSPSEE
ncbi:diglucosylglycerate octanoyltransferase [Lentzea flava]|uniref:diglucosylglycerate octanoyltransferase n=1 Tax=Lentzea flava TaxID=103732 RepID=UPI00166F6EC3|nr:diglucosylglycerate octanoyltransferase [Lentzea flava]MCP2204225.1 Lysophospholipase L1 [Lentzea flava]